MHFNNFNNFNNFNTHLLNNKQDIDNKITEAFDVNGHAEILFLTKYLGDYNISKYGKDIHITNENKTLVVERVQ